MYDVGDPVLNAALTLCFGAIALLTIATVIPWRVVGALRMNRVLRWAVVPLCALVVLYEWLMPSRFDIRVDLLLLLPMYGVVVMTSVFRWWSEKSSRSQ
jgi:hypothetical protein